MHKLCSGPKTFLKECGQRKPRYKTIAPECYPGLVNKGKNAYQRYMQHVLKRTNDPDTVVLKVVSICVTMDSFIMFINLGNTCKKK